MGKTTIEWATYTFNPWIGCTKVAAGCEHCYAERDMAKRLGKVQWGPNGTRVKTSETNWHKPLAWNRAAACDQSFDCNAGDHSDACPQSNRPRVFCASLADVFEEWDGIMRGHQGGYLHHADKWQRSNGEKFIEIDEIAIGKSRVMMNDLRRELFALIDATPNLDWLLLTKRPENIWRMWPLTEGTDEPVGIRSQSQHRANVWLGTSIANQADADRNIPELLKCRELAPVLFLSAEPLLGPIQIVCKRIERHPSGDPTLSWTYFDNPLRGERYHKQGGWPDPKFKIDWVICGGESGPHARPMHPDWARSLRDQCVAAGVPFFFKQWGEFETISMLGTGAPVFRQFQTFGEWVNKATTRVFEGSVCLDRDGRELRSGRDFMRARDEDKFPVTIMDRVGKQAAGRMLDGREWNELPVLNAHCS